MAEQNYGVILDDLNLSGTLITKNTVLLIDCIIHATPYQETNNRDILSKKVLFRLPIVIFFNPYINKLNCLFSLIFRINTYVK